MPEPIERPPPVGIPAERTVGCVGQEVDLSAGGTKGDCLLLEVDLGALVMGIRERAHEQQSHRARDAQRRASRRGGCSEDDATRELATDEVVCESVIAGFLLRSGWRSP